MRLPRLRKRRPGIECDIVDAATGQKLRTVNLPLVPHAGDELDLEIGGGRPSEALYRVVRVRYHVRPRRVRTDELLGVSIYVITEG